METIANNAFSSATNLKTIHVAHGDTTRVSGLLTGSGYNVSGVKFIEDPAVTFAKNDGTGDAEIRQVPDGEAVGTLPVPVRPHATFDGCFTEAEDGTQITTSTLVEESQYVYYYAHWEEKTGEDDWPADTSTVESQTAGDAFGITGDLAGADAKDLAHWAKAKGVDFGNKETIIADAFLLNCANTAAAVEAATPVAQEAIKITEITFDEYGAPQLTCPDSYGNGQVVIQGSATIGSTASWHDGKQSTDRFFRTTLKLK